MNFVEIVQEISERIILTLIGYINPKQGQKIIRHICLQHKMLQNEKFMLIVK